MEISLNTAVSGMQVSLTRQDVTANNIANVQTQGYSQLNAQQTSVQPMGVRISAITPDSQSQPRRVGHRPCAADDQHDS